MPDKPAGDRNHGESSSNIKTSLLPGKPAAGQEKWVMTSLGQAGLREMRAPTWDKPAYEKKETTYFLMVARTWPVATWSPTAKRISSTVPSTGD